MTAGRFEPGLGIKVILLGLLVCEVLGAAALLKYLAGW